MKTNETPRTLTEEMKTERREKMDALIAHLSAARELAASLHEAHRPYEDFEHKANQIAALISHDNGEAGLIALRATLVMSGWMSAKASR